MQLDLHDGDQVVVLEKVNEKWWWVELEGKVGYAPTSYLSLVNQHEDKWQDDEYYSSYASLVSIATYCANMVVLSWRRVAVPNGTMCGPVCIPTLFGTVHEKGGLHMKITMIDVNIIIYT